MAVQLGEIGGWVKEHPVPTAAIVFTGGLALLWMLGYIGGGAGASASSGAPNNLAAFYGAEAASAQAGAAIQIATLQTASDTAKTKIQADAATAIASTSANMQTTINAQNTAAATDVATQNFQTSAAIAGIQSATTLGAAWDKYLTDTALSWNADLAAFDTNATTRFVTKTNTDAATQQNLQNNEFASQQASIHENASLLQTILQQVIPHELALTGGTSTTSLPGVGTVTQFGQTATPNQAIALGFTPAQAAAMWGFSGAM